MNVLTLMFKKSTIIVLSLPPFFAGCGLPGGKNASDAVQFMLAQDAGTRWLFCVALVIALWQVFRVVKAFFRFLWWTIKQTKPVFFRFKWINLVIAMGVGSLLFAVSEPLSDLIQELEQRYLTPVWLGKG